MSEVRLPIQIETLNRSYYNIVGTVLTHKDGTERFTIELDNFIIDNLDNPIIKGKQVGRLWTEYKSQSVEDAEKLINKHLNKSGKDSENRE